MSRTDIDPGGGDRTRGVVNRVVESGEAYRAVSRASAQLFVEYDEAVYAAYSDDDPLTVRDLADLLGESTDLVKARLYRVRRLWSDPEKRRRFLQPADDRRPDVRDSGSGGFTALGEHRRTTEDGGS